jgi:ferredoxin
VLSPKYPFAKILMKLHEKEPDKIFGAVMRGSEIRAVTAQHIRESKLNLENLKIIGYSDAQAEDAITDIPFPENVEEMFGEIPDYDEVITLDVKAEMLKKMTVEERFKYFKYQFGKCIKCYGCRNVCPHCFCPECRLEDEKWVATGNIPPEFPMFHMILALHGIGRCVGCRECEAACPMDIPLTTLYSLMRSEIADEFKFVSGMKSDAEMPIVTTFDDYALKEEK